LNEDIYGYLLNTSPIISHVDTIVTSTIQTTEYPHYLGDIVDSYPNLLGLPNVNSLTPLMVMKELLIQITSIPVFDKQNNLLSTISIHLEITGVQFTSAKLILQVYDIQDPIVLQHINYVNNLINNINFLNKPY